MPLYGNHIIPWCESSDSSVLSADYNHRELRRTIGARTRVIFITIYSASQTPCQHSKALDKQWLWLTWMQWWVVTGLLAIGFHLRTTSWVIIAEKFLYCFQVSHQIFVYFCNVCVIYYQPLLPSTIHRIIWSLNGKYPKHSRLVARKAVSSIKDRSLDSASTIHRLYSHK